MSGKWKIHKGIPMQRYVLQKIYNIQLLPYTLSCCSTLWFSRQHCPLVHRAWWGSLTL